MKGDHMSTARELLQELIAGMTPHRPLGMWMISSDMKYKIEAHLSQPPRESTTRFVKPEPCEVTVYAKSIGYNLDGNQFCDHYASKDWKVGKTPMKDWKAAVRTWKRSDEQKKKPQQKPNFGW
jgi:hypothetical protein